MTSIPCKLLEELIKDQIISHLKVNNLLSSIQDGFTERRSCLTNLLITLEMITKAIDEDCPVDTFYVDGESIFIKNKLTNYNIILNYTSVTV